MSKVNFKKKIIAEIVNVTLTSEMDMNTFSAVGDINNDGLVDVVIGGRNGKMVWLENRGENEEWDIHLIDKDLVGIECGGTVYDITGNGYPDVVVGSDVRRDEIFWWENPANEKGKWKKRLIAKTGNNQFHDIVFADVTNDGAMSIVFTNQQNGGTHLYRIPIPEDPTMSPWPGIEKIASKIAESIEPWQWNKEGLQPEEGLAIGDIDGDGKNEIVCGTHWFKYGGGKWYRHKYAKDYISTKVFIADVDGDGKNEIILSEGDACIYNKPQGGKLAWFKPSNEITGMWQEHLIDENLLDPHSLKAGDICGNSKVDIFVGEIGVADENRDYKGRKPCIFIYENDGKGNFIKHIVDEGTGIHDGFLVDLNNNGKLDIVGKPLHGKERWKVVAWYNKGAK
ncbi:FG-GAP repeat domain-containing protein [Petroclostridium xylanilyticum]|uniref:FG-GAP repeat domain-containing protein n=1 Tax=Petroclostridium xylanilyticum TaxID=1792311 RepID=UPI000B981150|nr:VCBS repeat-containing protein [Petroclostridium xylanilyticum]